MAKLEAVYVYGGVRLFFYPADSLVSTVDQMQMFRGMLLLWLLWV